ncbi:MAG: alpha/beta fold hydrolase [Bauldia sp.]
MSVRRLLRMTISTAALAFAPLTAAAQSMSFDSAGVPIHYVDSGGTGAAVVLIHGLGGSSDLWPNAGLFPIEGFRTIAIDARGHGLSGKPAGAEAYGIAMAEDVARLLDHLEIEAAHLVGYSMGAEIALRFTVEHPEAVLSLTVGGSGWSGAPEYELYQYVGMSLGAATSFAEWVRSMQPDLTDDQFAALREGLAMQGVNDATQDMPALAAVATAMDGLIFLTEEQITAIGVPVLGIAGELDPERANIERMAGVVPDFTMVVIDGADHLAAPFAPEFAAGIRAFLAAR